MSQLKSITLRLPEEEYRAFDAILTRKDRAKQRRSGNSSED
jgi:hypothetical protein